MLELRPYQESDAKYIVNWVKDETSYHKWCAGKFGKYPLTIEKINDYYKNHKLEDNFFKMTAFEDNEIIGHFLMRFIDKNNKILRLGFIIINNIKQGKGYGKKMISLALKYAFEVLKANKVTLGVFENNLAAYSCYKSLGFKEIKEKMRYYEKKVGEKWLCLEMEFENNLHHI